MKPWTQLVDWLAARWTPLHPRIDLGTSEDRERERAERVVIEERLRVLEEQADLMRHARWRHPPARRQADGR